MAKQEKLELPVYEGRTQIEEGKHEGTIQELKVRDVPYQGQTLQYLDIYVSIEDMDKKDNFIYEYTDEDGSPQVMRLKTGTSTTISPKSKLGLILQQLGEYPEGKEKFNVLDLVGTRISYMTTNKETEKGVFAEILQNTMKKV